MGNHAPRCFRKECIGRSNTENTEWNVRFVPFDTWEANLRSIIDGTADLAWATPENPVVHEAAAGPHGIRFLNLPVKDDPEGAERFHRFVPFGNMGPAPPVGVEEIWGITTMVGTSSLWCRPDFDTDLAYKVTKWFDENYELYKDKGNKLITYNREAFRQTLDVAMAPAHEGAIKYFKEIGLWRESDYTRQEYNLKLMNWYCEAWDTAIVKADATGIAVSSSSKEWIKLWADFKKEIRIPGYRQMTDQEIQEGLSLLKSLGR